MSRRTERVAERIREEIGTMLITEMNDPRLGFLTVTRVEVSSDLHQAKVYLSILGSETQERQTMRALTSARAHIQSALAPRLMLRMAPEVSFHIDEGLKHSRKIRGILNALADERKEMPESDSDPADVSGVSDDPKESDTDGQ